MRIDRSEPDDGPDAHGSGSARATPHDRDATGRDKGTEVGGGGPSDSSPARPDAGSRIQLNAAYHTHVHAVYQQYAIDHGHARVEKPERETATPAMRRIDVDNIGNGGDVADDPRQHSNPKTGRFDASWSTYDRAIAAAREHAGGDLGPDSIKMYDYHPETGEGTGTLIGEQTPDRLRGWRIDGQDGHVNWWDWTGGKKGSGGAYGHDWFTEDPSIPGSRYIGWARWQDSDGNILEGN